MNHVAIVLVALAMFAPIAYPQGRGSSGLPQAQPISLLPSISSSGDQLQREQAARLFAARQIQLRLDTAKLVELTAQLKQQVDKTDINILSMDVVKKAQEIQKLAKSVQDKMKNGY
jgi:hypothetical protein